MATEDCACTLKSVTATTSEAADGLDKEEVRTQFGQYLTSQYELLERTLSALSIADLFSASLVCKSWYQTATYLLQRREKNNKFRWHLQCKRPCNTANCFKGNIRLKSEFLLGFQIPKGADTSVIRELLEIKPSGKERFLPGLFGDIYLIDCKTSEVPGYTSSNIFEYFSNRNAAVFFPKTDRYAMQTNFVQDEMELYAAIKESTEKYGDLKGILVFANNVDFPVIHILYNRILQELRRQPIALAGGIFSNVRRFDNHMRRVKKGVLTLCFYGDVDCYSDILMKEEKSEIEPFIKNMRQNLGDIDTKKYQRVAFVIRCLCRSYGKYENSMFRTYFPETPAFVMGSYGEYCYQADSSKSLDAPKRSKSDVATSYAYKLHFGDARCVTTITSEQFSYFTNGNDDTV